MYARLKKSILFYIKYRDEQSERNTVTVTERIKYFYNNTSTTYIILFYLHIMLTAAV